MAISLRDISFSSSGSLAKNVAASSRLTAMLPQAKLSELLAAYAAATQSLAAARGMRPAKPDIAEELDEQLRKGKPADVAKLAAEFAEFEIKHAQATRVIEVLVPLPDRYAYEIEALINRSVDELTDRLNDQLQDLLDRAGPVLADLGPDVTDGDAAIIAKKVDVYSQWLALHDEYKAIRRDHLDLLHAADEVGGNFTPKRPALGYAFFGSLDTALPDFVGALEDGGRTRAPLPFRVNDPTDLGHWRATVANRSQLDPIVGYADEAIEQAGAATVRYQAENDPDNPQPRRRDDLGGLGGGGYYANGGFRYEYRPKHHAS